jgi:hypothetical protein
VAHAAWIPFLAAAEFIVGANYLIDVYRDRVFDPRPSDDGAMPNRRFVTQFEFNDTSSFTALNFNF